MSQSVAVEMAPFALAEGVTQDALLEASDRLEREFLSRADGYMGRILVSEDPRSCADIVFWKSAEHAARAMAAAASSPVCGAYFKCMAATSHADPADAVTLFRSMKVYGPLQL